MSKKLMCLVLGMFVMGSAAFGATQVVFTDADPADHYWSTAGNWATDPAGWDVGNTTPVFSSDGTVCIVDVSSGPYSSTILSKFGPQGNVVQFDNTYQMGAWANIGRQNASGADGVYQIYGGSLICDGALSVPNVADTSSGDAKATLLVMGGLVEASNLEIAENRTDLAHIDALVDVRGGKIITDGDDTADLQPQINAGQLIAYGGAPGATIVMDYDVTTPGSTTIVALSGLNESPANRARGVAPGSVNLTWTTPADPNFAGLNKYVYFGEKADLNWSDLNDPNVYWFSVNWTNAFHD